MVYPINIFMVHVFYDRSSIVISQLEHYTIFRSLQLELRKHIIIILYILYAMRYIL